MVAPFVMETATFLTLESNNIDLGRATSGNQDEPSYNLNFIMSDLKILLLSVNKNFV